MKQDTLPSQLYKRKKLRQGEITCKNTREDKSMSQPASRPFLNIDIIKHGHVPTQYLLIRAGHLPSHLKIKWYLLEMFMYWNTEGNLQVPRGFSSNQWRRHG